MRLRYIQLTEYPPLQDFSVVFGAGAPWVEIDDAAAPPACAIHFVVGLNGSGKSHLLRAIARVFVSLADGQPPGFPCSIVSELGIVGEPGFRSVIFDNPGDPHQASLWVCDNWRFPLDADEQTYTRSIQLLRSIGRGTASFGGAQFTARIPQGDFPQSAPYALPRALLAYSSGALEPWEHIWHTPVDGEALDVLSQSATYDTTQERPAGWTLEEEARVMRDEGALSNIFISGGRTLNDQISSGESFRRPVLLEGAKLTAALLVVAIEDHYQTQRGVSRSPELVRLFQQAGWHRLVGVRFDFDLRQAMRAPRMVLAPFHELLLLAGEVLRDPHPSGQWRSAYVDVDGVLPEGAHFMEPGRFEGLRTQGQAIHALLGGAGASSFDRFGTLLTWMQHGLLDRLELFIRRTEKDDGADDDAIDIGVLRLSELSDGERMVLSRWALLHLLAGQDDALLLLDEPETHFNDAWKREIVTVVESAIGRNFSAAVIATHSAIVLSDVFDEEVVMVKKAEGSSFAAPLTDRTFATDPSALMMTVFDAEDSIGERAKSRIEHFMARVARKQDPTPQDVARLRSIIRRLGTGFYKTQLVALLHRWGEALGVGEPIVGMGPSGAVALNEELQRRLVGTQHGTAGKDA